MLESDIKNRRIANHFRNFERTIAAYRPVEPFSRFLTRFYKQNRQMGSSDRRMNSRYCYNFFRLGHGFDNLQPLERLCVAEFLCETDSLLIGDLKPEWDGRINEDLSEKLAFIESQFGPFVDQLFPSSVALSTGINRLSFIYSHFIQPDLFIRVKRGHEASVERALAGINLSFRKEDEQTFALPNGSKLQEIQKLAGLFEVQDRSSQRSLDGLQVGAGESWWDCCAASGGKSLLLLDRYPVSDLLVSDSRLSILRNLDARFEQANVSLPYRKKILDLSQPVAHLMQNDAFDGIILDAPCTGSGTWGRTPEMLTQFNPSILTSFNTLQRDIARHVVPYLKSGGTLVYITCSVFLEENEAVADFIEKELGLMSVTRQVIAGYSQRADTMFVAQFKKP